MPGSYAAWAAGAYDVVNCRQSAFGALPVTYILTLLSRSALPMTDTELSAIAALAIIGLNRMRSTG
ncbi:hypothetical protein BN2476_160035 [Paraburkholderia piptadeniae]|uniref:Uncharacterized protein n=1 Tax=Paraburkholderia piptadeniae TaxID=1701573 RepID=A0A1N7RSM0_9BURK|nr:hypothetical protein BN2476_160035 [Paraburkholderia piptadeniae]